MMFCQVWIVRGANRSNLATPQTFPIEKTMCFKWWSEVLLCILDELIYTLKGPCLKCLHLINLSVHYECHVPQYLKLSCRKR